jgi:hypothetical protein
MFQPLVSDSILLGTWNISVKQCTFIIHSSVLPAQVKLFAPYQTHSANCGISFALVTYQRIEGQMAFVSVS